MGAGESTCCPDSLDVGANCAERSQGCPSVLSVLLGGNLYKAAAGPAVQDNKNSDDLHAVRASTSAERRGNLPEYLRSARKRRRGLV